MSSLPHKYSRNRFRFVAVFVALLLISSAVPVFAAERPGGPAEEIAPPPAPENFDPSRLPGAGDVTEAIEEAELEEEERKAWLASPVAVREREDSRFAFADLDATGAEELLRSAFAEQLAQLNADPARFLSDARLLSTSESTSATVEDGGNGLVMESSLPVRAENEEGDLRKVDLSLEGTASGYETANALVEVQIPEAADQPVEVGEEGVAIKLAGADDGRPLQPFGDENALATEVLPDTDMLISPIATGVEVFNLLRSEHSPETFRFQIEMPAGAELRADGEWGAEVVREGELLTTIRQPVAVDAQGTDVPVDLQVEGDSLLLTLHHREGDYAMPILLDPILENNENWIYGQNHNALDMGIWAFNRNVSGMYGSTYCIYECFGPGGPSTRGLFVSSQSGTYWPHQFAQWSYSAPNIHSFISSSTLGTPYVRADHGCPQNPNYPKPHDYFGVWSANLNAWIYTSVGSANYPGGNYTLPQDGDAVIFGLGSGGNQFSIGCWRDLYAGGAHIWLDDWNPPWIEGGLSGIQGIPSGWVSDETPFTITAVAKDEGLGIKNVRIHQDGAPTLYDVPPQNECAGTRRSLCHTTHTASFDNIDGSDFFAGERDAWLNANDPTSEYTGDFHWTMRVDNTPPEMTLKGQFAEETNEVGSDEVPAGKGDQLSLPVYELEIEAKDGSWDSPFNKRSGVKDIEIYLDGVEQAVPWEPQPCSGPNYSCPMTKTYPVQLSKLTTSGKHVLRVVAEDHVKKRLKREIEFEYFPATGMKDEYSMHYFPLPDGSGNEAEEMHPDRPELAVNVMNGNLVYREQDVEVEGSGVDLEVERYYNSMLPESEDTEWGDGWTLAQTPELDPIKTGGSSVPNEAEVLDSSGAIEKEVGLPTEVGAGKFDPALQATLTKKSSGGYELIDETGESATSVAFDETGQTEALLSGGYAKVDYSYEGGELAEIEVKDPATFAAEPEDLEIPEPVLIAEPTFAAAFGSNGSGDGQLKSPGGVAIDPQGNLWVIDKVNNRIQKFDPSGKFISKLGSAGSGDGQFNRPTAIAIAANGDLLVTDSGNGRVQRFSSAGAFISKFGSKGTGSGQFAGSGPEGIAIDAAGNIWVSDTYGGRIQKFSSAGVFLQSVGTKGSAPGQLGEPTGIDVDPSSNLWVADWQNHRVSIFNAAGEFVSSFGSLGVGDGQFKNPDAIEIDNLGNVWVGDQSNHRIQQFDLSRQFKAKFGSAGSGAGQFSFSYPMDLAADSKGNLWVTDVNNHRIQHWLVPVERPAYVRSFGTAGSGDGQFAAPAELEVGVEGNLLVVDKGNNRIQRFDVSGQYLGKFGAFGSDDGQFSRPTAIAVDRDGSLLVTDSTNNRVQKFSPEGQFISKFGTFGTGNGQFSNPEGIATDFEGNVWVADSGNGRIQKFSEEGEFLDVVSSKGAEPGQLGKPVGIDIDPEGRIWVSDWQYHRVAVFEADGDFVGQFGTQGSGPGQFSRPSAIDIDVHGNVWVVDHGNGRVQRFDLDGVYVGQFGSSGSGEGQFSLPTFFGRGGIATDRTGRIWVGDINNNRIQQWMLGKYTAEHPAPLDLSDGDPKVEVETAGGLVASVTGNAAGEHAYEHEGDFLVSHDGPEGETLYEQNAAGLLSKVTLPNGTWASIAYFADNRVESVTMAPEGANAKTTHFHYETGPPRRSIVSSPNKPQITYDIGADGSVLRWWHKESPPEIIALNGSLGFDKNGKEVPAGDLLLEVEGDSPHGVASIQIIANGDQLVSEKTCEQDPDPEIECTRLEDLWVTDTASLTPGVLNIEVIVTNELEKSESRRWSVTIPHTPPPIPGSPVPPKFSEIQKFREDYGLEVVFPVANERELVERIFNLINAWHSPNTPAGEVARASMDRWGVPLRPADVAEMEYRERFLKQSAPLISQWGASHSSATYAGFYMDHRAGGKIRVGFTANQVAQVAEVRQQPGIDPDDRIEPFTYQPTRSLAQLNALSRSFDEAVGGNSGLMQVLTTGAVDVKGNSVSIGATDLPAVQSFIASTFGSNAGISAYFDPSKPVPRKTWLEEGVRVREMNNRLYAGDWIRTGLSDGGCTLAFGAWEQAGTQSGGAPVFANYALTAGHCYPVGTTLKRGGFELKEGKRVEALTEAIGKVERRAYKINSAGFTTDAEAIRLRGGTELPRWIYWSTGYQSRINGAADWTPGMTLCHSGTWGGTHCGPTAPALIKSYYEDAAGPVWQVRVFDFSEGGDSGSPVFDPMTGNAVGLLSGGPNYFTGPTDITPLLSLEGKPYAQEVQTGTAPGGLGAPGMSSPNRLTIVDAE